MPRTETILEATLERVLEYRRPVILVFWALSLAAFPGLFRLEIDNSPEAFFVRDALELGRYQELVDAFGDPEVIRVAVTGAELWSPKGLEWLETIESEGARLPGVIGAAGLWGHHRRRGAAWPPASGESFRKQVLGDPIDRNAGWVNADGDTTTVLLALGPLEAAARDRLLEGLDALVARTPPPLETTVVGLPVVNAALDRAFVRVGVAVLPALLLLAVLLLAWLLRSRSAVALPVAMIGLCEVVVFGSIGYAGDSFGAGLNVVSLVIAPLILVLTLATVVHVLLRFRTWRERGLETDAAIVATYREKFRPILWAGVTTGVGFGSLAVSRLPPVRATGLWLAFGITVMTVAVLTLLPALLAEFSSKASRVTGAAPSRPRLFERRAARWGRSLAAAAIARRTPVLAVFTALFLLAGAGCFQLDIDSNVLTYFRSEHPVRRDLERLESRGLGGVAADLVIAHAQQPDLERLAALSNQLRADPLVYAALSLSDFPPASPASGAKEVDLLAVGRGLLQSAPDSGTSDTSAGSHATRIRLLTPMLGITPMEGLIDRVERMARATFPEPGYEIWLSGRYPLVIRAQRTLLSTLAASLSLTFLCVAAAFWWTLESLRLTLCALASNLWPVAGVLGAMGWLGVPLEGPTVMIAAVALGLAVDDTLHFVGEFKPLIRDRSLADAAIETQERIAGAELLTSLILAVGFGACALSGFVPVARFGALMALAVAMALASDLLLMPALVARRRAAADR